MAALIPDERSFVLAGFIFFLLMKTEQAISGTRAATYKVMEPHWIHLDTPSNTTHQKNLFFQLNYMYTL